MGILVGIDVGGTFTDFVAYDPASGALEAWKGFSTPGDPADGIIAGLSRYARRDEIEQLRIGTTIATNAILERSGAVVAYVTTKGFRDIPFIQRGNRKYHYSSTWIKPAPLVRRKYCFEINERLDAFGEELKALDEAEVRSLARTIAALPEIEAVAVNLLFSYTDPAHERRVGAIFREVAPHLPVSLSYDVLPKWKEYERASTTISDAYVRPRVSAQLRTLKRRLAEETHARSVVVMKSNGGTMSLDAAADSPIHMAVSGPTGGVVASRYLAALAGFTNVVTLDMGGTSTDCASITGQRESITTNFEIEWGLPIQVPMLDIQTIGAGGGSIAWIDKGGLLRVGPRSAGARPGPVCYGRGGTEATVTDANLVIGRINPDNFLGGTMRLDVAAAGRAISALAERIGQPLEQTAHAIVQIANDHMVGALRAVLIARGLDPRDYVLMAFGGAGPLHAADLLDIMLHRAAVIPPLPGQFSAFGFTAAEARVDRQRTIRLTSRAFDAARANAVMDSLVADSVAEVRGQSEGSVVEIGRSVEARYFGQNHELELPVTFDHFDERTTARLFEEFDLLHRERYGFSNPGDVIEVVNFAVSAIVPGAKPALRLVGEAEGPAEPISHRRLLLREGWVEAPVYARSDLRHGHVLVGPSIVEEDVSATPINMGQILAVDQFGNLVITRTEGSAR